MHMGDILIPVIITGILICGVVRRVNIAEEFAEGAKENLMTAAEILPMLILLMTAVGMFSASGAAKTIAELISPVTNFLGFPDECIPLAIIRPISGSGALATLETILTGVSPDSYAGRVAGVLMGSTETTFYTITVYYAALRKKPDSRVFISAAAADITGFIFASLTVRLFFR